MISTRDCFVYDLHIKETVLDLGKNRGRVLRKDYYFKPESVPGNYLQVVGLQKETDLKNLENLRVGVHTYENFYSNEEMLEMERMIEDTEKKSIDNAYLPMTA